MDGGGSRNGGAAQIPGSFSPGGAQQSASAPGGYPNAGAQQNISQPGQNIFAMGQHQPAQQTGAIPNNSAPNPVQFAANRAMSLPEVGFNSGVSPTAQIPQHHFSISGAPGQPGTLGQPSGNAHGGPLAYGQQTQQQTNSPFPVTPTPQVPTTQAGWLTMPQAPSPQSGMSGMFGMGQQNTPSPLDLLSMSQTPSANLMQANVAAQRTPGASANPVPGNPPFGQTPIGIPSPLAPVMGSSSASASIPTPAP